MFKKTAFAVVLLMMCGTGYAMEQDPDPNIFPTVPLPEIVDVPAEGGDALAVHFYFLNAPHKKQIFKKISERTKRYLRRSGRRVQTRILSGN